MNKNAQVICNLIDLISDNDNNDINFLFDFCIKLRNKLNLYTNNDICNKLLKEFVSVYNEYNKYFPDNIKIFSNVCEVAFNDENLTEHIESLIEIYSNDPTGILMQNVNAVLSSDLSHLDKVNFIQNISTISQKYSIGAFPMDIMNILTNKGINTKAIENIAISINSSQEKVSPFNKIREIEMNENLNKRTR